MVKNLLALILATPVVLLASIQPLAAEDHLRSFHKEVVIKHNNDNDRDWRRGPAGEFRDGRHNYRRTTEGRIIIGVPFIPWSGYHMRQAYCADPQGFYPDVQVCYVPWERRYDN